MSNWKITDEGQKIKDSFIPPENLDLKFKVRMRTKRNWKKYIKNIFNNWFK